MQLSKNILIVSFVFIQIIFAPTRKGNSQTDTTQKPQVDTDSLFKAVENFKREVDSVDKKFIKIEAKINDNQKKAKEIDNLVNQLVKKASTKSKPKVIVRKVVEKVPVYIPVENPPPVNDSFDIGSPNYQRPDSTHKKESGIKRFFKNIFKRKK